MLDSSHSEYSSLSMPTASEVLDSINFPVPAVAPYLDSVLIRPLQDMGSRKSKNIRRRIVEIGYALSGAERPKQVENRSDRAALESCGRILEQIHLASLIVDDIEDDSQVRRGEPTLHRKFGMPVALNAGNWLYFWQLHELRTLNFAPETELQLYRYCMNMYVRAHCGQAFDVGMPVDKVAPKDIPGICMASVRLKTGALMEFAMGLTAIVGGASNDRLAVLERFGDSFGVALQCFDDVGNTSTRMPMEKRFEDLKLLRPTWLWAVAAEEFSQREFSAFMDVVQKYKDDPVVLDRELEKNGLRRKAFERAEKLLDDALSDLNQSFSGLSSFAYPLSEIEHLANLLRGAYGC